MAKLHTVLGPQVHSLKEMTVGRFYHVVDDDGEHVAVKLENPYGNATVVQVDYGVPCGYREGDTLLLNSRLTSVTSDPMGKVFKFAARPDAVRYRGKRVESVSELTVGRWYILVRGDRTMAGQYSGYSGNPKQGYFNVPGLSNRVGHVITGEAGDELRATFKFTEVPKVKQQNQPATPNPRKAKKGDFLVVHDAGIGNKVSDGEVVKLLADLPYSDETMVRLLKSDGSQAVVFSRRVKPVQFAEGFPAAEPEPAAVGGEAWKGKNAKDIGAKEGDRFVVVDDYGRQDRVRDGDVVELSDDDGSTFPWFKVLTGDNAGDTVCLSFSRLAPPPLDNQPKPEEVSSSQVLSALAQNNTLASKARAVGLLANEVEKRYNAAQEAIQAHTVANEAYQNALMDLLKLSKEATANETLQS